MSPLTQGASVRRLRFAAIVRELKTALVSLVSEGPPPALIRKVYDHQPGRFKDAYPALSVEHTGFEQMPGGSNEIMMPNAFDFTVRVWVPVLDPDPETDGYAAAQDAALDAFDEWFTALLADSRLGGRALFTEEPRGQVYAVQGATDVLYAYEASIRIRIH